MEAGVADVRSGLSALAGKVDTSLLSEGGRILEALGALQGEQSERLQVLVKTMVEPYKDLATQLGEVRAEVAAQVSGLDVRVIGLTQAAVPSDRVAQLEGDLRALQGELHQVGQQAKEASVLSQQEFQGRWQEELGGVRGAMGPLEQALAQVQQAVAQL